MRHSTSSCGPTRDGRLKPDIIAPGDMILSSLVQSLRPVLIAVNPSALTPEAYHVRDGGTSSAAPGVAGIAALFLQKNPEATAIQVKNAILNCARHDLYTGSVPNNQYGFGKADGFKTLSECTANSISKTELQTIAVSIFPNPGHTGSSIHVDISLPPGDVIRTFSIYNELGACVFQIASPKNTFQFNQELPPGIYFCRLLSDTRLITTKKLVIL